MNTRLLKIASVYSDGDRAAARFDLLEALYWLANDYHEGQWSRLYRHLSTSPFHPSPLANGPEPGSVAEMIYQDLTMGEEES